jgi:predicted secreted protein
MAGETINGSDILLYVNTGTESTPAWTAVGGQSGIKITETNGTKERKGHKLSPNGDAKEYNYDQYEWKVSLDGAYVSGETGLEALRTALRTQALIKVRVKEGDTYVSEGDALITSMDLDGPYNDDATYAIELQGTGKLTTTNLS